MRTGSCGGLLPVVKSLLYIHSVLRVKRLTCTIEYRTLTHHEL